MGTATFRDLKRCLLGGRLDAWIADRYRTTLQDVEPGGIPSTDFLFVDVDDLLSTYFTKPISWNVALRVLSYITWTEMDLKQSEETILRSVTRHIEFLVEMISPKREVFISTGGSFLPFLKIEPF